MSLFSYLRHGVRTLINLRAHPSKVKRYPFSSTRQHERHARRQFTVITRTGFHIMQTSPSNAGGVGSSAFRRTA